VWNLEKTANSLAEKLKCSWAELTKKTEDLLQELKQKNQEILQTKQKIALEKVEESSKADVVIYSLVVSDYDMDELRSLGELVKSKKPSGIIVIASHSEDKVSLVVSVGSDLQEKYSAGHLLKLGLVPLNGKGGGNAAFAQGGGVGKEKIVEAIEAIKNAVN
jgi:alanyl-tRNA synthetase